MKKHNAVEIPEFNVSIDSGLTDEQVETLKNLGKSNKPPKGEKRTVARIIFDNVFKFFNLIFLIMAIALIAVGSYKDLMFMVIITANIIIGIIQEIKAKNALDKLSLLSTPSVSVIRNGQKVEIKQEELVLQDIFELTSGKQVTSDSVVQVGTVEVNEALLTGESVPVMKNAGDKLFAGSYVVSGSCFAKVIEVGAGNYIQKLALSAKVYQKPKSEIVTSLSKLIKIISLIIIPLGALILWSNFDLKQNVTDMIVYSAGSMLGMIPAGMFLLTSVALAVGVIKLAKLNTVVQKLYCIEMLARVNVLCLDKTGTITDGTMSVEKIIDLNNDEYNSSDIVSSMQKALNENNQTARALQDYFGSNGTIQFLEVYPFASERKFSGVTLSNNKTYILGAPEMVKKDMSDSVKEKVNDFAKSGYRVLMLAKKDGHIDEQCEVQELSLIVISDHIREDAKDTINDFQENGVTVKIISGDSPVTVAEVARRAGVLNTEKLISLDGLSDDEVIQAVNMYTVFGRVTPDQKRLIIKTLKNEGNTVAMTGDGINDILAMKEADCSIAMASGSEAARNVCDIVLMNNNFASMPEVVKEGRRVINNIERTSSLFITKTLFSIALAFVMVILRQVSPFRPSQLMLYEVCCIGIPSFILALEQNNERIKGRFLTNILKKSISGAITVIIVVSMIHILHGVVGYDIATEAKSISLITTVFVGLLVLNHICRPYNTARVIVIISMVLTAILVVLIAPGFFDLEVFIREFNLTRLLYLVVSCGCATLLFVASTLTVQAIETKFRKKE